MVTNHIISCLSIRSRPLPRQIDGEMGGGINGFLSFSTERATSVLFSGLIRPLAPLWEIGIVNKPTDANGPNVSSNLPPLPPSRLLVRPRANTLKITLVRLAFCSTLVSFRTDSPVPV